MTEKLSWDQRYRSGEHLLDQPAPLIAGVADGLIPARALDLASGTGRHTLLLAARGWQVTAVDASHVAIGILEKRARDLNMPVEVRVADLEKHEFEIEPDGFDLICDCYYLQRDLFPAICAGVRPGGLIIAIIHMLDDSADVKPMNPAYLLRSGELAGFFAGWRILHAREGKPVDALHKRAVAEIVAQRPIA